MSSSHAVSRNPCAQCGSSDANVLFDDGHSYCFRCAAYTPANLLTDAPLQPRATPRMPTALIEYTPTALPKRGLSEETCRKLAYGVGEYNGNPCQVATYFDKDGQAVAQKLRFAGKRFMVLGDISQALLFGQQAWGQGGKSVIVTEGEIDALSVSQIQENKWPVVSIPSGAQGAAKALQAQLSWLESFDRVVLMFDMDEPGRAASVECAQLFSPGKCLIASLPLKDASECLVAGNGQAVVRAFWDAKPYWPDAIIAGEELMNLLTPPPNYKEFRSMHRGLDAQIRGYRSGEVWVFTAASMAGKSWFAKEEAVHLIDQGEKVFVINLEEPKNTVFLDFVGIRLNRRLRFERQTAHADPEVQEAAKAFKDKLFIYNHEYFSDPDHVFARARFAVKSLGCSVILLDHLTLLALGGDKESDERVTLDRMMTQLGALALETNCLILVVVHLKKPSQGTAHEEGAVVHTNDLRGSHGIFQRCRGCIALERNQQADNPEERHLTRIRVLKCSEAGDTGPAGFLRYDPVTGRMLEANGASQSTPEVITGDMQI